MSSTAANTITGVHLGTWTNWSFGSIRGATLTITRRDGGLLTAFIALFVAYAGTRFWQIVCYLLHHSLSSNGSARDTLYHQRQAILRNSASGAGGIWAFVRLAWGWKRHADLKKPLFNIMPMLVISSVCAVGFAVAGIFSSQVSTKSGNEVLVSSKYPGFLMASLDTSNPLFTEVFSSWMIRKMVQDRDYARQCYQTNASEVDCPVYVEPSLPVIATRNASCPFQDRICRSRNGNLILDTGLLNGLTNLGVNYPPKDQFAVRIVTHCAPIENQGYTSLRNESDGTQFLQFHYGKSTLAEASNVTYECPVPRRRGPNETHLLDAVGRDYSIGDASYAVSGHGSAFLPIEALQVEDADIHLIFLSSNNINYLGHADDP